MKQHETALVVPPKGEATMMNQNEAVNEMQREEVPDDVTVRIAVYVTSEQHLAIQRLAEKLGNIDRLTSASGLVRSALDYGLPLLSEEIAERLEAKARRTPAP